MADIKLGFAGKWDAIAGNDIADNANASSAARDNSVNKYIGAWIVVKCNDGAGADADGWTLSMTPSVDGGGTYVDASTFIIGTGPSPDSGTIIRAFRIDRLPSNYKLNVLNETGAAADFDVDVMEDYFVSA